MPTSDFISNNCTNRIKPALLRDVKTEALLAFSRTALERYFQELNETKFDAIIGTDSETIYVYDTLKKLLSNLQDSVVNVDYLINLVQSAKKYPELKMLAKHEEPLIGYYDIMAQKVRNYYEHKPAYLPEFLIICVLEQWILEEEKSTSIYPFLNDIDFLELISKFESNRKHFYKNDECKISEIHELSSKIIEKLKNYKYKANKSRVSKTRKRK